MDSLMVSSRALSFLWILCLVSRPQLDKSIPAGAWGHRSLQSWGRPGTITLFCSALSSAFGCGWCLVAWTDRQTELVQLSR